MSGPPVLVVGETPSLGRSVVDLLESAGIVSRLVPDLERAAPLDSLGSRHPVVVVASAGHFSPAARRWANGDLPRIALVVVGSRDPVVTTDPTIRFVPLPLSMNAFLALIRDLVASADRSGSAGTSAQLSPAQHHDQPLSLGP